MTRMCYSAAMQKKSRHHRRDGDDDKKKAATPPSDPGPGAGDYNLGDEIGTHIGEGHDPIEDPIN